MFGHFYSYKLYSVISHNLFIYFYLFVFTVFFFQIAEKLHARAKEKKPDKYDFINLANRVEEFTLRFLDPLKYEEDERKEFFNNSETGLILKTAIKLEQKKVMV